MPSLQLCATVILTFGANLAIKKARIKATYQWNSIEKMVDKGVWSFSEGKVCQGKNMYHKI